MVLLPTVALSMYLAYFLQQDGLEVLGLVYAMVPPALVFVRWSAGRWRREEALVDEERLADAA